MDAVDASPVDACLAAVERGDIGSCSAWASDAVLDAIVPNWRLRLSGPAATRAENGVRHAAHHMHVLEVRDGVIQTDAVICGGRRPDSLLTEMNAAQRVRDEPADA